MKNNTIILIIPLLLAVSGCEGWLNKEPLAQMSPESFFSNENELQAFSNNFYKNFTGSDLYQENYDLCLHMECPAEMRDGRVIPGSGSGWTWTSLRNINTLLEYSVNCEDAAVRSEYDAVARFFRAYFYFEKVKRFGDVPWYDRQLGSADPDLYKPRDSRELVMQKMIEDIDYAIANLPAEKSLYRVTKWTALALKSRFCLFEGTFRKYHEYQETMYPEYDWEWYLGQCVSASEEFMNTSGYGIYTADGPDKSYLNLFVSENANSQEIILARDYNKALNVTHNANYYTLNAGYGRPGLSKKIVNSYLMSDGSRFTDIDGYDKMEFYDECQNRDPRLAQSIRTPGYTRIGSSVQEAPDFVVTVTGYQPIKYVAGTEYDSYNTSAVDLPVFRTAEVYLNYAEAKAELGTLTQADLDNSIKKIRDRVGMPNIDLAMANSKPDKYMEKMYTHVSEENKGVILEIRRERTVELSREGFRYYDIIRWKEGQTFTQKHYGMYFKGVGEYDLDKDGTIDLCLYQGSRPDTKATLSYEIGQDIYLSEGDHGYVDPYRNITLSWNEDRDYFYPIPTDDRSLTGGALTQNPGWNDGLDF